MSMPSVWPSAEKLWQLAQVGMSPNMTRLAGFEMSRRRHLINGRAPLGSGMIRFFFSGGGINGTSR